MILLLVERAERGRASGQHGGDERGGADVHGGTRHDAAAALLPRAAPDGAGRAHGVRARRDHVHGESTSVDAVSVLW